MTSTPSSTRPSRAPTALQASVLLAVVVCGTLPMAIGPVLPQVQQHFASVPGIAMLTPVMVTLPSLVMALTSVLVGLALDRWGRQRLLLAALALYGLAGTAPLWLDDFNAILVSRAVVGLCEAVAMTCSTVMLGDYFTGTARERYIALQTSVASVSGVVFNLIGGLLGDWGWRGPFAMYGLTWVLLPLAAWMLWEPTRSPPPTGRATPSVWAALRRGRWPCLSGALGGFLLLVVPLQTSFLLHDAGLQDAHQIGLVYALNCLGVVAGTLVFGYGMAPRLSLVDQFLTCAATGVAGFALLAAAPGIAALVAGSTLASFACGLALPATVSWALRSAQPEQRGAAMGAFMSLQCLGMFCNPLVMMPLAGVLGSRSAAIAAVAWALLPVCAALLWARRQRLAVA